MIILGPADGYAMYWNKIWVGTQTFNHVLNIPLKFKPNIMKIVKNLFYFDKQMEVKTNKWLKNNISVKIWYQPSPLLQWVHFPIRCIVCFSFQIVCLVKISILLKYAVFLFKNHTRY